MVASDADSDTGDDGPDTDGDTGDDGPKHPGDDDHGVTTDGGSGEGESDPAPTPQSAALRRQQRHVGVGGAVLAGGALAVGTLQQFPDSPAFAVGAGVAATALVLWLVRKSIFPGETAVTE
mgnify:CR=1 FL=1